MRTLFALILMLTLATVLAGAAEETQTDWSGGGGAAGPESTWGNRFAEESGVSWRAIPGQLALSSAPLAACVDHLIEGGFQRPFGISAADIDGDGDMDVMGGAGESGVVVVWLNDGSSPPTLTTQIVDMGLPGATSVYAFDINGDGHLDLVAGAENPGNRVVWYENSGTTPIVWTRHEVGGYLPVCCMAHAADINGDGHMDIFGSSWSSADMVWYENDGAEPPHWATHLIDGYFNGAHCILGVDLDGDEDMDVLGAAGLHNDVTWWRNDGGDPIVWTEQVVDSYFYGGHSVYADDMDGDGDMDILGAAAYGNEITWWENCGGDPLVWLPHVVATGYEMAVTVYAADIDGDGDQDVLGTGIGDQTFRWWEVSEFIPSGELTSTVLDLGGDPEQVDLDWTAALPPAAELFFQVRSSNDPANPGPWSGNIASPGSLSGDIGRYVQYKAIFATSDPAVSAILADVQLVWDEAAAVSRELPAVPWAELRVPTPARNGDHIHWTLPEPGPVILEVFDACGRCMACMHRGPLAAGRHQARLASLLPGVYLCRLEAGGRQAVQRLVMVD